MTETERQRDGRVLAEAVLFNLVCSIEGEINRLYIYAFKDLRDMHKERLERELKEAKCALEWAKGMAV